MHPILLSAECCLFVYRSIIKDRRVYHQEAEQRPSDTGEEDGAFRSRLPPSVRVVPISHGGNDGKIELKIKYNSILFYFNLSIILGIGGRRLRGRIGD